MSKGEESNKKVRKSNSTVVSAIAGLVGTAAGKAVMHPVDTIKAKL